MTMGVGGGAASPLSALASAADVYERSPLPGVVNSLNQELIDLRLVIDGLEVRFSRLAARSVEVEAWEEDGAISPYRWLRNACKMGTGQAIDRLHLGFELPNLPESAGALQRGEIGYPHLVLIAETAQAVRGAGGGFDEGALLAVARQKDVTAFRDACHHLRHGVDPEGYAEEQAKEKEEAYLQMHLNRSGGATLKGYLDREGAAALRAALAPLARRLDARDVRHQAQRNAEALVELARHALDTGRLRGRPHLQVTASIETLTGMPGAPAAELEHSVPVGSKTVERIACDCSLTRVIFGADSQVIEVGRTRRTVSGSRRRALNARDRHCRWPGCDRPASWSDAHHLVHWVRNGATDLDNLVLLCHRHHWMAHEGGWQVVKGESGDILAIAPTSTVFAGWIRGPALN